MAAAVLAGAAPAVSNASPGSAGAVGACPHPSWPMLGRSPARTFEQRPACTSIDATTVRSLVPKWVVHTKDSVTASPAVVDGTVYVGSWDGTFYAVDAATGTDTHPAKTFTIDDDHAVAFGRIVSSAAVADFDRPDGSTQRLVLFGGGATLYAVDTALNRMASIDLDPRDDATKAAQAADRPQVEIESSPVVAEVALDGRPQHVVYVGMDVHNRAGVGRTGVIALTLDLGPHGWSFTPRWKFDVEAGVPYTGPGLLTVGSGTGLGCGGVWSSPAVDEGSSTVFFGSASCSYPEEATRLGLNAAEAMFAVDAGSGQLRWKVQPDPTASGAHLDDDFGATPNLYRPPSGQLLVGEGRKSGEYAARRAASGDNGFTAKVGSAGHVQQDYAVGGFLGSTAVWTDGGRARAIVGATAVPVPESTSPDALARVTWAVRALDPADGHLLWTYPLAGPSYGSTTITNGVALVPDTFTDTLLALDASTGQLLWSAPLVGPPASAAVAVGDSVYIGAGVRETDAEFKSFGSQLQDLFTGTIGNHPLSPVSGIQAFTTLANRLGG